MNYHALGLLPPGTIVLDGGGLTSPRDSGKLRSTLKIHEGGREMSQPEARSTPSSTEKAVVAFQAFNRHEVLVTLIRNDEPVTEGMVESLIKPCIESMREWDPMFADLLEGTVLNNGDVGRAQLVSLSNALLRLASFLAPQAVQLALASGEQHRAMLGGGGIMDWTAQEADADRQQTARGGWFVDE